MSHILLIPVFSIAEQTETFGVQPFSILGNRCKALLYASAAFLAFVMLFPSALLIISPSASSIIPLLIPCNSSPAPDNISSKKKSDILLTVVSLCPTPTVSIKIISYPAASHKIILSLVLFATPPKVPLVGLGRINAFLLAANSCIRLLSPSMLPCVCSLVGSIAKTATFLP